MVESFCSTLSHTGGICQRFGRLVIIAAYRKVFCVFYLVFTDGYVGVFDKARMVARLVVLFKSKFASRMWRVVQNGSCEW